MQKWDALYNLTQNYNDEIVNYRVQQQLKMIHQYVKDKHASILDIGCFGGLLLSSLYKSGYTNLFGSDILDSKKTIHVSVKFSIDDITKRTHFRSNSFDLVIISHTLEHLYDVESAMDEIKRITKKNGYVFITIPLDANISGRLKILFSGRVGTPFILGSHIKFYHPGDFEKMLDKKRLKIQIRKYSGLGYGKADMTFFGSLSKLLAKHFPNTFAGEAHYLLQNKK